MPVTLLLPALHPSAAGVDTSLVGPGILVKLDGRVGDRLGDGLLGAAAVLTQYLLGGFFAALAVAPSAFGAHPETVGRLLAGALAVGVYAFGRWGRREIRRAAVGDARLIVQADALVIRHGAFLAAPAVIPWDAIRVVAADPAASPSSRHSLPVAAETGGERLTWFWQRYSGAPVPLLGPPPRAPNLALLFARPIHLGATTETGVLLRVKDVVTAQRAFAGRCVVRPLTGDDLAATRALAGPPAPAAAG
jgi:hypothetical protein